MEALEGFAQYEYFNEVLVVVGAILALIGIIKVLGASIKLILWVGLVAIGVFTATYGVERSSMRVPPALTDQLEGLVAPGKELSEETLHMLCARLDKPTPVDVTSDKTKTLISTPKK